jgi:putative oxygen-independent coproporphyrinogen III oxidase
VRELSRVREQTGPRYLTSIFFGGGTPSLMAPHIIAEIIDQATKLWTPDSGMEITLEANPTSVESQHFREIQAAGVNRVSLGIQSLRSEALAFLGRTHNVDEAKSAIRLAASIFPRSSFDLIYARPQQTLEDWREELQEALCFGTTHLSLYQLTIEPNTAFATQHARGDFSIPEGDFAADLFELTDEITREAGLPRYEVSNHAVPGQESRHNLAYWLYQDYAGIGPGAHGRLTLGEAKVATRQFKAPETWLKAVLGSEMGDQEEIPLSPEEQAHEAILMGLRLEQGLNLNPIPKTFLNQENINLLIREGLLIQQDNVLKPTPRGLLCLNRVIEMICNFR